MDRPYENPGSDSVSFFIGTEVEQSPAHGMKTLFVVGLHSFEEIQKLLDDAFLSIGGPVKHIYFGANMSFPKLATNDSEGWRPWENVICAALDAGYYCTLDIDVTCVEGLLESGITEHNKFIPMISVKLPYVQQLGYNATIKIDDKGFNKTNPGVWCHTVHSLLSRTQFTDWSQYTKDTVLK